MDNDIGEGISGRRRVRNDDAAHTGGLRFHQGRVGFYLNLLRNRSYL